MNIQCLSYTFYSSKIPPENKVLIFTYNVFNNSIENKQ